MRKHILRHPFTMLISGPTGCGKTTWLKKLINDRASIPKPDRIIYFYGEYQSAFKEFKKVTFVHGLRLEALNSTGCKSVWIIIDDLMSDAVNNKAISDLFTKGSHHRNVSVILVVQNFFVRGKEMRNISLNSHYIVLFKNPRDKTISLNIARQMYPHKSSIFNEIFEDATRKPFSYLFIDLKPDTPESERLLTNIFGEEGATLAYII